MWRSLPQQGARVRAIQIEPRGMDRSLVIVDATGERLRLSTPDIRMVTSGTVLVHTRPAAGGIVCVTFTAPDLVLQRAEVHFDGSEKEWELMWRRAQTQSRPWWQDDDTSGMEIDLDWPMDIRLKLIGAP